MIAVLSCVLIMTLIVAYWFNEYDLISPSVLYVAGFVACSLSATVFASTWDFKISDRTFLVVFCGSLCFVVAAFLVHIIMSGNKKSAQDSDQKLFLLPYNKLLINIFILIQLIVIVWTISRLRSLFPGTSILEAISGYRLSRTFDAEKVSFGFPLDPLRNFCYSAGYLIVALTGQQIAHDKILKSKNLIVSLFLAIVLDIESGSRTDSIGYVFALFVIVLLFKRSRKKTGGLLTVNSIFIIIILLVVFAATFQAFGLGRKINRGIIEYLSVYCGSQICNLNSFLESTSGLGGDGPLWGYMTLVRSITYLGQKLGIADWVYSLDLPYHIFNGYNLGNVYTTYYAFIYDFGYAGIIPCVAIMATISQIVFEKAKRAGRHADTWAVTYSYIAYSVLLCFFSNKFYEGIISFTFIRFIVYFIIARYIYLYLNNTIYKNRSYSSLRIAK